MRLETRHRGRPSARVDHCRGYVRDLRIDQGDRRQDGRRGNLSAVGRRGDPSGCATSLIAGHSQSCSPRACGRASDRGRAMRSAAISAACALAWSLVNSRDSIRPIPQSFACESRSFTRVWARAFRDSIAMVANRIRRISTSYARNGGVLFPPRPPQPGDRGAGLAPFLLERPKSGLDRRHAGAV